MWKISLTRFFSSYTATNVTWAFFRSHIDDWECRNCQEFHPIYNELADHLSKTDSQVRLGKVDATKYRHLIESYNVGRLPALVYFRKRIPLLYTGKDNIRYSIVAVDIRAQLLLLFIKLSITIRKILYTLWQLLIIYFNRNFSNRFYFYLAWWKP